MKNKLVGKLGQIGSSFCVFLLSVQTLISEEVQPQQKLELIASLPQTNVLSGSRIALELIIVNNSAESIRVNWSTHPILDYSIQIVGTDGEPVPLTRLGNQMSQGVFVRTRTRTLAPGQSHTNTIVLSQLFDLSLPQTYEVKVSKKPLLQAAPVSFQVREF